MMQFGGRDAGGLGDGLDLRLVAPMVANMTDSAAHYLIVGGSRRKRHRMNKAIGREHVCLHHLFPI